MKRVIVDEEKGIVKLSFNSHFYKEDFINQAVQAFSEICNIRKEEDFIYLEPKNKETDLKKIGYEFYNYTLAVIKNS